MSHVVHAIKCSEGFVYRIWSTTTDSYITPELNEVNAREFELDYAASSARESAERHWPMRVGRAQRTGTSGLGARTLDRWNVEKGR